MRRLRIFEIVLFAMLGVIMFLSDIAMELLPNVHLIGTFTVAFTVVFRKKALIPIYLYIALTALISGGIWWIPYLYIWLILWGAVMLLPKRMSPETAAIAYMFVSGIHGLLFGILYAPAQAIMFDLNFEQIKAWVISGFPLDLIHGIGNFICGALVLPIVGIFKKMNIR